MSEAALLAAVCLCVAPPSPAVESKRPEFPRASPQCDLLRLGTDLPTVRPPLPLTLPANHSIFSEEIK